MNLLAENNFGYFLQNVFTDWAAALFIFCGVLIILAVLFKGLKLGIKLMVIFAIIAGVLGIVAFVVMLTTWDLLSIIDYAIKWVPTLLFVVIVVISTLVNAHRGFRKSLILLIQSVVACGICIGFYYYFATTKGGDKAILSIINSALGGNTLQNVMGVSEDCKTIREIFIEYLPNVVGGDMQILLAANSAYLITLADMVFRIAVALVTVILFHILVFLFYIIYLIAYPERRYKKKIQRAIEQNKTNKVYSKHPIGGGAVGLVRGVTIGLLTLSFIGSGFYVIAGGTGSGTLGEYDFGNESYNTYYSIYRSIDRYGSEGIFKILNSMTDADDTPFYLFAADMVFSGNLDDEENGIDNENIEFRAELGAYIGFAKNTMNLLLKYGGDDVLSIINGGGGEDSFDKIVDIMSNPEFRTEFDILIEEFNSQTYIINFGYSLIGSIVDNIDNISFTASLAEDNRELIKLIFKEGYLSDTIPDERQLKEEIAAGSATLTKENTPPRLKISHLIQKSDVRLALQVALSIISGDVATNDTLGLVRSVLPQFRQLSILQTSRSGELDPVISRLYCYVENKYLIGEDEEGVTYASVKEQNVQWLNELNVLLDVTEDALTLWENIYEEGQNPLNMVLSIFDKDNENYDENIKYFDNISTAIEESKIIDTVMASSFMHKTIKTAFVSISENIYIPEKVTYNTTVNPDGTKTPGEMSHLLNGFRLLAANRELMDEITGTEDGQESDMVSLLNALSDALGAKDDKGNTLSTYLTESQLLRSLISIIMIEKGAEVIYVPESSLDKVNGEPVNMIQKAELKYLLDNVPELIELVEPILNGEDGYISKIAEYIQSEKFDALIDNSHICEATVAKLLMDTLDDVDVIVVPYHLQSNLEDWISTDGNKGELRNLLASLKAADLDIGEMMDGEFDTDALLDKVLSYEEATLNVILGSEILHYTISDFLIGGTDAIGFKIIIPLSARTAAKEGDSIEYLVAKNELIDLFSLASIFDFSSEEMDIASILRTVMENKKLLLDSKIMSATIVNTLVNNEDISGVITIPVKFIEAGSESALENYGSSNIWSKELPCFINALDEILGISENEGDFKFDGDSIKESLSAFLTKLNDVSYIDGSTTKLKLCYKSDIIKSEITVRLDDALKTLVDSEVITQDVIDGAKTTDGYYKEIELETLSNALIIFDIDLLNLDDSDLTEDVIGKAFELNNPRDDFDGQTGLEVVYGSSIIRYIFSSKLDEALDGLIEEDVLRKIKGLKKTYDVEDVAAFIDSILELGIEDFDSVSSFDFSALGNLNGASDKHPGETRLSVIFKSDIAAGVMTKQLYSALTSNDNKYKIDHPLAYRDDMHVYKQSEIECLYEVFFNGEGEGDFDFDNFDISSVDLSAIGNSLWDGHQTRSYLIAAAVSAVIKDDENFIIPSSVINTVENKEYIAPEELALVIQAFTALYDEMNFGDLESWELVGIPTEAQCEKLFASVILRARITYEIGVQSASNGEQVVVSKAYADLVRDTQGNSIAIISEKEFNNLSAGLRALYKDSAGNLYDIPKFNINDLADYDEDTLNLLLASDIIYYQVCDCILDLRDKNPLVAAYFVGKTENVTAINLSTVLENTVEIISRDTIAEFLTYYKTIAY